MSEDEREERKRLQWSRTCGVMLPMTSFFGVERVYAFLFVFCFHDSLIQPKLASNSLSIQRWPSAPDLLSPTARVPRLLACATRSG